MPKALHDALQRKALKTIHTKGKYKTVQEHRNAFVYGGMRHKGWKPYKEHA